MVIYSKNSKICILTWSSDIFCDTISRMTEGIKPNQILPVQRSLDIVTSIGDSGFASFIRLGEELFLGPIDRHIQHQSLAKLYGLIEAIRAQKQVDPDEIDAGALSWTGQYNYVFWQAFDLSLPQTRRARERTGEVVKSKVPKGEVELIGDVYAREWAKFVTPFTKSYEGYPALFRFKEDEYDG